MKDFLGNELNIGDEVVFLQHYKSSSTLYKGKIQKMTNCFVFIGDSYVGNTKKEPCKCMKVTKDDWYLVDNVLPESSCICSWFEDFAMKFTTVWVTIKTKDGDFYVREKNRILMKYENFKEIPEENRKWQWSRSFEDEEIVAWKPYVVPEPYRP